MLRRSLILLLAIVLVPLLPAADEARIPKLIIQLGSASFTEREEASKALDAIGAPALTALKQAAQGNDVETRMRAEDLIARIEKRQESARLLTPTRVTVKYEDTPLPQAVADLAKQSKQNLILGDANKLAGRKVTLEVKDVPFWQALEQFCAKAGVVESSTVSAPVPPVPQPALRRRPAIGVVSPQQAAGQIVLVDGKLELPTHHAGAARIQALPVNTNVIADRPKGPGEILFALGLGLEAQVPLQQIINVRIDKAADEHGQALEVAAAGPPPAADPNAPIFLGNIGGRVQAIASTAGHTQLPIRLKAGDKDSKKLTELTGIVAIEVRTPPEPIMTVDDVLKAAGQTVKGKQGGTLSVRDVKVLDGGQVRVRVEMEQPPATNQPNGQVGGIQIQGNVVVRVGVALGGGEKAGPHDDPYGLSLFDAKGESFSFTGQVEIRTLMNINNQITSEYLLTFKPKPGQGPAARLVYTARRPAMVEVPFTLKDVPLP